MAGLSQLGAQLKSKFAGFNLGGLLSLGGGGGAAVGLSIGTSSVKIVELQKSGKIWKLLHFGMIQLPEDAVVNREIVNGIAVVDSIKTLVNQLKLSNKTVCTSLSGASMIIKRMQVEAPNPKELKEQVFWEAEQYLPFDASEVAMDFQLLAKAKGNLHDVLLVGVDDAAPPRAARARRPPAHAAQVHRLGVNLDGWCLVSVAEHEPSRALAQPQLDGHAPRHHVAA